MVTTINLTGDDIYRLLGHDLNNSMLILSQELEILVNGVPVWAVSNSRTSALNSWRSSPMGSAGS